MNKVKGAIELGWDIFWKKIAIFFNFRSETDLKCVKKVTDPHKGVVDIMSDCPISNYSGTYCSLFQI